MSQCFQFKQLTVHQDRCGMKVGTDGVLLGAWAEGGKHILDIGTGTGLIALMLAQRCPEAEITGVELDEQASLQAQENVTMSAFALQVKIENMPIQQFSKQQLLHSHFNAIVSNPPFYHSLKSKSNERTMARHTETLTFKELVMVKTVETKKPKRCLISFVKQKPLRFKTEEVTIKNAEGEYTPWYVQLTGDFYLK